jgi:hypothetical protein
MEVSVKTTPESSVVKFSIGQHVTWHYQPAGGLGYEITAQAKVIKIGKARIQIEVPNSDGLLVQRWVPTGSLAPHEVTAAQPAPHGPVRPQGKAPTDQPRAELNAPRYPSSSTWENTKSFLEHGKLRFATRLELPQDETRRKKKRKESDPEVPVRILSNEQLREEAAWHQVQETGKPLIFEGTLLLPPNMSLWDAIELLPDDIRDQTREIAQNGMARVVMDVIERTRAEIEERAQQSGDLEKWNSFSHAAQMAIAESVFRHQFGWTEKPVEELLEQYGGRIVRMEQRDAPPG